MRRLLIAAIALAAAAGACTAPISGVGARPAESTDPAAVTSASASPRQATASGRGVADFAAAGAEAWALTDSGLFATSTAGASWVAITPAGLDLTRTLAIGVHGLSGWLVASAGDGTRLLALTTHDGGVSWTTHALPGSSPDGFASVAVDAVDDTTVWVSVRSPLSAAENIGYGLRSLDGGATWTAVTLPSGEPVSFRTPRDGWQVGGAVNQSLSRTVDGGATWTPVRVTVPATDAARRVGYSDPVFFGSSGVLPVFLWTPGGGPLLVALYTTESDGDAWALASVETAARDGSSTPVAVIGPRAWLVKTDSGLLSTADAAGAASVAATGLPLPAVGMLTATGTTVWALGGSSSCTVAKTDCTAQSWLDRSTDGGVTWASAGP